MSTVQRDFPPANPPALSGLVPPEPNSLTPPAVHGSVHAPTRAEWTAAGFSLVFHLILMLVLFALLIPVKRLTSGSSIDGGLGTEDGDGQLFDSVTIGSPDPGKGEDLEKTATTTIDGVPAVEGALAGSSGSGTGLGRFDVVAALGSGGGGKGGKGVGFFGTRARAETVVFVVDMSGSMQGRRFERAEEELIRSLNSLQPTQKFWIFFYNSMTHPMFEQRAAKLVAATPAVRAKAVKWVKSLEPAGDTAPEDALERALKLKPQVIYFLTDGEIPDTTRDTAKKFNSEHKTVIHTIAFETEEGAEMLRGIAVDGRGKYRFVP